MNKMLTIQKEYSQTGSNLVEGGNSCSLKGSILFSYGIKKALPLLHAGPGCSVCASYGHILHSGETYPFANTAMCSNEIIFGGEKALKKGILAAEEVFAPDIIVITSGCQALTIGDDIEGVIDEVIDEGFETEIINSGTGGYDGDLYYGFVKTGLSFLKKYCRQRPVQKKLVNIIGFPAHIDIYWKGNITEIKNLLHLLGLEINCFFPGDATIDQIKNIPAAELNLVVDEQLGVEMASLLEQKFGTPFIIPSYGCLIGSDNTMEFFLEIINQLDLPESCIRLLEEKRTDAFRMTSHGHYLWVEMIQNAISDFAISAHASLTLGLTRLLMSDLGMEPKLLNLYPAYQGSKEKLNKLIKLDGRGFEPIIMLNKDNYEVGVHLEKDWPSFYLGKGTMNMKYPALQGDTYVFKAISYPSVDEFIIFERPIMGFNGIPALFDDLMHRLTASF